MKSRDLFEILVRENAAMLETYLVSVLPDASAVDDVFQETLVAAWRALDRYDRQRPFGAWLRGIATRQMLAHGRRAGRALRIRAADIEVVDRHLACIAAAPGDTFDARLEGVRACVEALPEPYRETICLRYADEVRGEALASRLGVSFETIKKRLQRARTRLLDCLQRRFGVTGATS